MEIVTEKDFSSKDVKLAISDIEHEMASVQTKISDGLDQIRKLRCKYFILSSSKNILQQKYCEITGTKYFKCEF